MENYLEAEEYNYNGNKESAEKNDILKLINDFAQDDEKKKIAENVKKYFKIQNNIYIDGSKEAINVFKKIDNIKYDYRYSLNNLSNINFAEISPKRYKMTFSTIENGETKIEKAETIYNSRQDFLNKLANMEGFARYLLQNNDSDFLKKTINQLKEEESIKNKELKFRFIDPKNKDDKNSYLRSVVTTKGYKYYDNPVVLYIAIVLIQKMSKELSETFTIENMYVTDSKINIYFFQNKESEIEDKIKIKMGLNVSNSEIGNGAASYRISYRISNSENKKVTLIDNKQIRITHNNTIEKINENLNNLNNFKKNKDNMVKAIKIINWSKKITKNEIYTITRLIRQSKNLKESIKKSIINKEDIFKDTFNLLEIFNKIQKIPQNMEDKLTLEEEFLEWIKNNQIN